MKNKTFCRICVALLMAAIMTPVLLGLGAYSFTKSSDGVFYAHAGSSSSMLPAPAEETSLGALPLPGHSIVEDYRADILVRSQQYIFKSIIMILIISIMLSAICGRLFEKSFSGAKKIYRLLI